MLKKLLFSLVAFVIFLVLLESAARLIEIIIKPEQPVKKLDTGWQTKFFTSHFDWHESDPELLWRFKANINNPLIRTNSQHFIGQEVETPKPDGVLRVLLLGDSSPVGLGLENYRQTFGEQLKDSLQAIYPSHRVELINAAVSGYSSEQVKIYFETEGLKYEPDLVIVYCGNNDASFSGYHSDREILSSQKLTEVRRGLSHLAFYRLLKDLVLSTEVKTENMQGLVPRVSPEEYGENLAVIADACRAHGCPLIIIEPAVPYLWPAGLQFRIFTHVTGEDGKLIFPEAMRQILGRPVKYCLDPVIFYQLYGPGDKFTRSVYASAYDDEMTPDEAVAFYTTEIEKNDSDAVAWNNLGVSYWEGGQYDSAEVKLGEAWQVYQAAHDHKLTLMENSAGTPFLFNLGIDLLIAKRGAEAMVYLDSALQLDYFSLRIKADYIKRILPVGQKKDVYLLDLPLIFRENGGETLFFDHCHPTLKGHKLIADGLFDLIYKNELLGK